MKTLIHGDFKLVCNDAAKMGKIIRVKSKAYVSYFFFQREDIYFTHIENLPMEVSEAFRTELMRCWRSKWYVCTKETKRNAATIVPIHRTIIT